MNSIVEEDHDEIKNFIKVCIIVTLCSSYCYTINKTITRRIQRFIFIFPIISIFLYLPLLLHSSHLCGIVSFFIAWLANFKLLLLIFDSGPLYSDVSLPISFPLFLAITCLPIKVQKKTKSPSQKPKEGPLNYAIKVVLLGVFIRLHEYSHYMHQTLILLLYAFHIYFLLELILVMSTSLARTVLGLELEPVFDEPYLATSLQDFWGKRWNLMVTSIMNPSVYKPCVEFFKRVVGRVWAPVPASLVTFLVSGLMHELVFYYLGRVKPSGEITGFFVLHGVCLAMEMGVKKYVDRKWELPKWVSGPLTVGFVMGTGLWLFFPQFGKLGIDVKAFDEYRVLMEFGKRIGDGVFRVCVGSSKIV